MTGNEGERVNKSPALTPNAPLAVFLILIKFSACKHVINLHNPFDALENRIQSAKESHDILTRHTKK